jgi:hypothetical protein
MDPAEGVFREDEQGAPHRELFDQRFSTRTAASSMFVRVKESMRANSDR